MIKHIFKSLFVLLIVLCITSSVCAKQSSSNSTNSSSRSGSVNDIMNKNRKELADTPRADYIGNHQFMQNRKYLRQQAIINALARISVIKKKYEKVMANDGAVAKIDKNSKQSAKDSTNQAKLENNNPGSGENKFELLNKTASQKIATIKFLMVYKLLRASSLEYDALIALSQSNRNKTQWKPGEPISSETGK